jgi:protein kinase C substrate 80K-H
LLDPVAKHYKDSTFACISNPSIKIDFAQVNDDFCDCPDGSDEPGTSACSNLSPLSPPSIASDPSLNSTAALPGFYCKNKGHNPAYIPFTYVNDGVCDYELCCDGSDEWAAVGGVKCEDKCKELGAEWRKQNDARQKAHSAAMRKRRELVVEAARLRKELEHKIADLKVLIEGDEKKVTAAEAELAETEKQEALRVIKAPKKGGKLGTLASLTRTRIEELKTNLQKLKQMQYDTEFNVRELEGILAQFKDEYNPNFNDEGVKRAVRAWEGYEARGRQPPQDREFVDKIDDLMKDESEHGINWDDFERDDDTTSTRTLMPRVRGVG